MPEVTGRWQQFTRQLSLRGIALSALLTLNAFCHRAATTMRNNRRVSESTTLGRNPILFGSAGKRTNDMGYVGGFQRSSHTLYPALFFFPFWSVSQGVAEAVVVLFGQIDPRIRNRKCGRAIRAKACKLEAGKDLPNRSAQPNQTVACYSVLGFPASAGFPGLTGPGRDQTKCNGNGTLRSSTA